MQERKPRLLDMCLHEFTGAHAVRARFTFLMCVTHANEKHLNKVYDVW